MKRVGYLYEKVIDKNNIRQAILYAAKGKRKRRNVRKVLNDINFYVEKIYDILKSKSFEPKPYRKVKIMDGVRKKERIIYKPAFYPDQIIHWALMLQLEPILMKRNVLL